MLQHAASQARRCAISRRHVPMSASCRPIRVPQAGPACSSAAQLMQQPACVQHHQQQHQEQSQDQPTLQAACLATLGSLLPLVASPAAFADMDQAMAEASGGNDLVISIIFYTIIALLTVVTLGVSAVAGLQQANAAYI